MRSFLLVAFLVFVFCGVEAQRAGTLDSSFGQDGKVITTFSDSVPIYKSGAITLDGSVVYAGSIVTTGKDYFSLLKYSPDGVLDNSFGVGGKVINRSSKIQGNGFTSVANLSDGRIIAAGIGFTRYMPNSLGRYPDVDIYIARYNPNGSLDSTFGDNGWAIKDFGAVEQIKCMAVQKDGKIVVAGSTGTPYTQNTFLVARFMPDGTLDTSFADDGKAVTIFSDYAWGIAHSILIQPDNKIVIGGADYRISDFLTYNFALVRYNEDGSLDQSFGVGGEVITDFSGKYDEVFAIALQSDSKIIAAGIENWFGYGKNENIGVVRYNVNGSIDRQFGNLGKTIIKYDEGNSWPYAIAVQPDDKIITTGYTYTYDALYAFDFAVARLLKDGIADSSFGVNGRTVISLGEQDIAYTSLLKKNGNIVCEGSVYDPVANEQSIGLIELNGFSKKSNLITRIKRWILNHTLNWQYNADVDYFVIEQSSNGVNDFKEFAKVKAVNHQSLNVNDVYTYNLNDFANSQQLNANSKTYYRIIAVSNNSKVVSTVISDEDIVSITISPNPVKDVLKISGLSANQKTTINIVSRNGSILQSAICNSSVCNVNVAQLKSGLYNVQVNINGKTQTLKFVKE